MGSKVKWTVGFERVNDDWSVDAYEVWCYATDAEAVKVMARNVQDATLVRITEVSTGKVVYDYEEELRKNGEKINAIYAKKYNGNFRI